MTLSIPIIVTLQPERKALDLECYPTVMGG